MSGSKWLAGLVVAACFAISISPAVGMNTLDRMLQNGMSNLVYVYIAGCISGVVLVPYLTHALKRLAGYLFLSKDEGGHDLYRLDHGILNVEMPPASMWMNIGFWEQTTSFPAACRGLLDEVLMAAGLLGPDRIPFGQSKTTRLRVIDLGFGCGDQSIYLTQLARKIRQPGDSTTDSPTHYFLDSYVGLTIVPSQFRFANERLYSSSNKNGSRVKLFCADAAKPWTWTKDLHEAATDTSTKGDGADVTPTTSNQATWVLALDTLYHFIPSREPIFRHTFRELNASIMAFDLLLSDTLSIWDLLLLRLVSFFAATPFSNFLTITEYRNQLLAAGYDRNKVEIRDISDHVFAGMASFIERRDGELKNTGMTIGRYKAAGKVFKWWARSGIVRGCIIVARR
ncbi:hypothetical protein BKA64DRAFT_649752 [Cadophora sp. MPI-SDFR-AT-0126]|nr:hypothetical protein BKA64DRAFT_649752 [Leotiomycetes sp. MPI-SDFR-AT-0126]